MVRIETGLFSGMVLQRTQRDVSDQVITGRIQMGRVGEAKGMGQGVKSQVVGLRLRVKCGGKVVRGVKIVGRVVRGRFNARLMGLRVGGPYDVELSVGAASVEVRDVLVGDVWLLAGQSNMEGYGLWLHRAKPVGQVRAFYMDDRWAVAEDPIHNMWRAVDGVHPMLAGGEISAPGGLVRERKGVGPGVAFGQTNYLATQVPQGLIACAHGGTSMLQWKASGAKADGQTLFGATMRRLKKNGGRVAGVIWYQGESDGLGKSDADYTLRMKKMVSAFRRIVGNKTLPFVLVQLGRHTVSDDAQAPCWNSIQEQQRLLPRLIKQLESVPAIDLELDDGIHISGESQQILGGRLARAMMRLRGDRQQGRAAMTVKKVESHQVLPLNYHRVVVTFDHGVGPLRLQGRATGFSVSDGKGFVLGPFKTVLRGNKVDLCFAMTLPIAETMGLSHGLGYDPVCTIVDGEGWPLPVFGPIQLHQPQAMTPFPSAIQSSKSMAYDGLIRDLVLPRRVTGWLKHRVKSECCFFNVRSMMKSEPDPKGQVIYMRTKFKCDQAMNLEIRLGYDGPIKVWLDANEVLCDPKGKTPAFTDYKVVRTRATRGVHRIDIALDTDGGLAYGVFVRLKRLGVSPRARVAGQVVLPAWV